ncbi:predicted protein [Chaetoceros tenuissimus]|uniref:Uncharacterized protein n=1 Tax=Chaetoceros tenuissimus TaxID=426638 RepID=A0AAD3D5M6_9STRA|nr:predicted protein [Chaetoceros tenuissimus]
MNRHNACLLVEGISLLSIAGVHHHRQRPQAVGASDPLQFVATKAMMKSAPLNGPAGCESAPSYAYGYPKVISHYTEITYGLSLLDLFLVFVGFIVVMMLSLWLLLQARILRFELVLDGDLLQPQN